LFEAILGIVFAAMNAAVEEFIIRGMIWNGLLAAIGLHFFINLTQFFMIYLF
jgi:hypothetical protein